ncbi:hypothetical protein K7X08_025611 [Anisodus acutangulus]|uniref:Uncharacterized protein n=1 Tax=Anisodus acutangulus TaxID=402998 RepID=A0A9Q1R5Z4_9SOLA|nr:hypothetical protein K7X08_025611 [Anisodus acutangulus]
MCASRYGPKYDCGFLLENSSVNSSNTVSVNNRAFKSGPSFGSLFGSDLQTAFSSKVGSLDLMLSFKILLIVMLVRLKIKDELVSPLSMVVETSAHERLRMSTGTRGEG